MLTTGDLAKLFHVSSQTVINWLAQGRMPYERIGTGPRRIREADALRYIREIGISPDTLDAALYQDILRVAGADQAYQSKGPVVVLIGLDGKPMGGTESAPGIFARNPLEFYEDVYNHFFQLTDAQTQTPVILHRGPVITAPRELIWHKVGGGGGGRLLCSPFYSAPGVLAGWVLCLAAESRDGTKM